MGRSGITFEQVQRAVLALQGRGKAITYESVRGELGAGCYSTIGKHMRTLREREALSPSMTDELPSDIASSFASLMAQLWQKAQAVAAQDVEALRRTANARVLAVEKDLEQVTRKLDATMDELDQSVDALSESTAQVRALEQAQAMLHGENEGLTQQLGALKSSIETQAHILERLMDKGPVKGEKTVSHAGEMTGKE